MDTGGDAVGQLRDALSEVGAALSQIVPAWLLIIIGVILAIVIGILIGSRMTRQKAVAPEPEQPPLQVPLPIEQSLPAPENPALKKYQKFLEGKGVTAREQDGHIRDFAKEFKDMRQRLRDILPGDKTLETQIGQARTAFDEGEFSTAKNLLLEVGDKESSVGLEKRNASIRHLTAASTVNTIIGDLNMAHLDFPAAAEKYKQAIEVLPPFQEELHAELLNKHGTAAYQAGDHQSAIVSFERGLGLLQKRLGKNHPDVATSLNNLALIYYSRGNYEAAEPLYRRSLSIDEQTLGIDHPGVATDLNNLALLYKKQGDLEAAEPLLKRALEIKEKNFDPGHPSLITGLNNYASLLRALDRKDEADLYQARASVLPPARTDDNSES